RSVGCGSGSSAATTPRWRRWAPPGCGTSRPSSRCREWRFCPARAQPSTPPDRHAQIVLICRRATQNRHKITASQRGARMRRAPEEGSTMTVRRSPLLIALSAAGALALSACGGGTLGGGDDDAAAEGPLKIGLLVPQSGVYKSLGDDMKAGFEVYLEEHDNTLGG